MSMLKVAQKLSLLLSVSISGMSIASGSQNTILSALEKEQPNHPSFFREKLSLKEERLSEGQFGKLILEVTGAQADIRYQTLKNFSQTLIPLIKEKAALRGEYKSLEDHSLEPELLIRSLTLKEEILKHLSSSDQTVVPPQYSSLNKLMQLSTLLDHFKGELGTVLKEEQLLSMWIQSLEALKLYYHDFHQAILKQISLIFQGEGKKQAEYLLQLDEMLEPKALLMGDLWPSQVFRISQKTARSLVSLESVSCSKSTSNHRVSSLPSGNPQVFFKCNGQPSLQPGKESMVQTLYEILGIAMPFTSLLMIDHVKQGESYESPYFIQASQAIQGVSGKDLITQEKPLPALNLDLYAQQVLGAFLTDPCDGKPDNFIYIPSREEFISIDNDEVFAATLLKGGRVHLKSMLYTFSLMSQSLSPLMQTKWSTVVGETTTALWLKKLNQKNQGYQDFKDLLVFHQANRKGKPFPFTLEEIWQSLNLPIRLPEGLVYSLLGKFQQIQKVLRDHRSATLQDLFDSLNPVVGPYYARLRQKVKSAYQSIHILYEEGEENILLSLLPLSTLLPTGITVEQGLAKTFEVSASTDLESDSREKPGVLLTNLQQNWPVSLLDKVSQSYLERWHAMEIDVPILLQEIDLLSTKRMMVHRPKEIIYLWFKVQETLKKGGSYDDQEKAENCLQPFLSTNLELNWLLSLEKVLERGWPHKKSYPQQSHEIRGTERYRLPLSLQKRLFNPQEQFQRDSSLTGRAEVTFYPQEQPQFYFKKNPELPGYDYAAGAFMRRLGVNHLPYSELFAFYHPKDGLYPVYVMQAVLGEPLYKVWDNPQAFSQLDPYHTGLLILSSMLINPEDGKEDNYLLTPDKKYIIPIDQEHVFLPGALRTAGSFIQSYKIYETLQSKSILFCLDEMQKPFPANIVQHIGSLNVSSFLEEWMHQLGGINERYQSLFPQDVLQKLWKEKGVILRLPFSKLFIENLHWKFNQIQSLFAKNPKILPIDLLNRLEPYVGKRYKTVLTQWGSLKDRFREVTKGHYSKGYHSFSPHFSVLNSGQMMEILNVPTQEIMGNPLSSSQGPIAALDWLKDLKVEKAVSEPINGIKLKAEQEKQVIESLFGVNASPQTILLLHNSRFLKADLLTEEWGKSLHQLDLRGAQEMGTKGWQAIYQTCPQLEYLNMSGWKDLNALASIQSLPIIGKPILNRNPILPDLKRLIVNECPSLDIIYLFMPSLQVLEAQHNTNLMQVIGEMPKLASLDVRGLNKLTKDSLSSLKAEASLEILQWPEELKRLYPKALTDSTGQAQSDIGQIYYQSLEMPHDYREAVIWYKRGVEKGNASALNNLGNMYLNGCGVEKNPEKALELFKKSASESNPRGYAGIASIYYSGAGVEQNFQKAREYLLKAADHDDCDAQYGLGILDKEGKCGPVDYQAAFKWFLKSAEQGHPGSQDELGDMYFKEIGIGKNYDKAFYWYQKAADQGMISSQLNLAWMYYNGYGTEKDYKKAFSWYQQAVVQGNSGGQVMLGWMYLHGLGVNKDYIKAWNLFEKAAAQGSANAKVNLGWMYLHGLGVNKDYAKALQLFQKADENSPTSNGGYWVGWMYQRGLGIERNNKMAQTWFQKNYNELVRKEDKSPSDKAAIGRYYLFGEGVERDFKQAYKWFREGAEEDGNAQACLGRLYKEGLGIEANKEKAFFWIEKSAEQDVSRGLYNLGLLYRDGEGVAQNDNKAIECFEKAAQQNNENALYSLGWMYEQGRGVKKDKQKALTYYQEGEKAHAEDALYSLGRVYEYGLGGLEKDLAKALEWYEKAAALHEVNAQDKVLHLKNTQ